MTQLNFNATTKEVVVGNSLGYAGPAGVPAAWKESLTGKQVGNLTRNALASKEVVAGMRVGQSLKPAFMHSIKEVIGRDSSYKFLNTIKEVLVSAPGDNLIVSWTYRTAVEAVTQKRATMLQPSHTWSYTTAPQLREQIVQKRAKYKPISLETTYTLRQQAVMHRGVKPPSDVFAFEQYGTLCQVVVKSRYIPYNPVSGNFTYIERQQVVQKRPAMAAPSTYRGPVQVALESELVVQSKRIGYQLNTLSLVELVVRVRTVTFSAPTRTLSMFQLSAQNRTPAPIWRGDNLAVTEQQQVVQQRATGGIVRSPISVATYTAMLAQHRVLPMWISYSTVYNETQVVVQKRATIRYYSPMYVWSEQELVVQKRAAIRYYSPMYVQTERALIVQHRETQSPDATSDWRVKSGQSIVVQRIDTPGIIRGYIEVQTMQVQYALRAVYPNPIDVIGPERGAQNKSYFELAVQHRETEAPESISTTSRFVFSVAQRPVVGDQFANPALAFSNADVFTAGQSIALGDQFGDPAAAFSDADVFTVGQSIALGDPVFPDPSIPLSDALVRSMFQVAPLSDKAFSDPRVPLSNATVFTVGGVAAVGDDKFPDPTLPTSEVIARTVGAFAALGDTSFISPSEPQSPATAFIVAETLVLIDKRLYGIPKRTDRRRPVVTIAMS